MKNNPISRVKIRFVLNEPRNPKNIGAAARGMANFGFRDLAVVNPYSLAWRETRSAVNAHEVVTRAKKYDSLKEALRRSHVVIGTSAASRRAVEGRWIDLDQARAWAQESLKLGKSVAVVFGSERSGLSKEDLTYCHALVRIPTVPDCPSMNLAQAVAVMAYQLRTMNPPAPGAGKKPDHVSVEHLERLVNRGMAAFTKAGLLKGWDEARSVQRLRKAIYRWNLTDVDIAMLHGIFGWVVKKA